MNIRDRVTELTEQLESAEADLVSLRARIAGLRAERDALEAASSTEPRPRSSRSQWAAMKRTEAIVRLLEEDPQADFSIQDVRDELHRRTGVEHDYQTVASTLNYLSQQERIMRVGHGLYGSI